MNPNLLRPFDLEAAKRGEEILYVYTAGNTEDTKFVAEAGVDGDHACRDIEGNIFLANEADLRMRPLAWVEDRPVYKGDALYSKHSGDIRTVTHTLKGINDTLIYFTESEGHVYAGACSWTKPKPVKKTRTMKFLGWMSELGVLVQWAEGDKPFPDWKRVPGADVTYEVEE